MNKIALSWVTSPLEGEVAAKRRVRGLALLCVAAWAAGPATAGGLAAQGAPAQQKFLDVDEAFQVQPPEWRNGKLLVGWRVTPGYYLYRHRLGFEWQEPAGVALGDPTLPKGENYHDEHFGDVEIYTQDLTAGFLPAPAKAGKIKVRYQGCAKAGLCYPPQTRVLDVEGPPSPAASRRPLPQGER